jgi:hypothetical protein
LRGLRKIIHGFNCRGIVIVVKENRRKRIMKAYRNNKFGAILTTPINQEEFTDAQLDKIPSDKLFYYLLVDTDDTEYTDIVVKEDFDIDGVYIHQAVVERDIEIYRKNYGDEFVNSILAN